MNEALISIKPEYVQKFIEGRKLIEIRNRRINLQRNSRLWIYSTKPEGCIQAFANVVNVEFETPGLIWERYEKLIGISKAGFDSYVNGSKRISAIVTKNTCKLPVKISLEDIREKIPGFHPPQFLKYMKGDDPLLRVINILLSANNKISVDSCDTVGS